MRYFHRTSASPDLILAEAERHFGDHLELADRADRLRSFRGTMGAVRISIGPEGGHYVRVTAETDQVGESELDKLAKRFLGVVHKIADPTHEVRGAY